MLENRIAIAIDNLSNQEVKDMLLEIIKSSYTLVQWPYSQKFMDEEWFDEEASLADYDKHGSSAFFIPTHRTL
jgi:hypothetical protein